MMLKRRNDPPDSRSCFRSDRMVQVGDEWYFQTREGTVKGPFGCRADAQKFLETYIQLAVHDMLNEGAHLSMAE